MKKRLAVILGLLLLPPACGMVRDGRPAAYADLEKRASFDLHCEKPAITPIKEGEGSSCTTEFHWAQTAGVRCSERQATYEYIHGRWMMNNSATERSSAGSN